MIVLVTDPRCLYYMFKPQTPVETEVPYSYCDMYDSESRCVLYGTDVATSTYTHSFVYDGEECVSAVLSVYGPVFLGAVLLAATLPAGLEMSVVPWLAPWCHRNAESSTVARASLACLRTVTWNVWPALVDADVLAPDFSLGADKIDYLAQRVVERAFVQVTGTLILALTFGIAVPAVGGACALAALVQLLHHRHVLGQIVALGRIEQPAVVPNLMGCKDVPAGCALVVVATVFLVWLCAAVGYLEPTTVGVTLMVGPVVAAAVASGGAACWIQKTSRSTSMRTHVSTASETSSGASGGMLMEPLMADDEVDSNGDESHD
jgi:hypothetical protein